MGRLSWDIGKDKKRAQDVENCINKINENFHDTDIYLYPKTINEETLFSPCNPCCRGPTLASLL